MLFFLALHVLFAGFVHNSFIPREISEYTSSTSQAAESFQQEFASSNIVESCTDGVFGQQEHESTSSSQKSQSFQESSSSNLMESYRNGVSGLQKYESSASQAAESFQESSSNAMQSISRGISGFGLQEYESSQTRSTSSSSKSSSANYEYSSSTGSIGSTFDYNLYASTFEKCKFISETERNCYLKWLETFSQRSLSYYNNILEYLTIKEALSNEILDYSFLQKEIFSVYEMFSSNGVYDVSVDLSTKKTICEKSKSRIKKALKGLSQDSAIYEILKFSLNTDITTLPCTIGLVNSILKNQETYFSKKSVSSSTSVGSATTSNGPCVDVTKYENILKAANIQTAEYQTYLTYLSKLSSDKLCLFTGIIDLLNKDTQVLTTKMILDFASFDREVQSIYELLVQEQFYTENVNWSAKEVVLTEVKAKLSNALSYLNKDCCMYQALQYCLEENISCLPLFIGLNYYVFQQQSSYFTSSTVSSSGSSDVCVM